MLLTPTDDVTHYSDQCPVACCHASLPVTDDHLNTVDWVQSIMRAAHSLTVCKLCPEPARGLIVICLSSPACCVCDSGSVGGDLMRVLL